MRLGKPWQGRAMRLGAIILSASAAADAHAHAHADILYENFNAGIPASWTIEDYQPGGSGLSWGICADTGLLNYTSASGFAACADSDAAGEDAEFDIALVTPAFVVPEGAALEFWSNYQNYAANDFADVDIDAGNGWVNLLRWNEDHGWFKEPVGEFVSISLDDFAGATARLRFHYWDPGVGDWDWYWQIDEVRVTPAPGSAALLIAGCAIMLRRRK